MQELNPVHQKQVAWFGTETGPKHLYKRNTAASYSWARACPRGNREMEYAMFQDLRRNGHVLVTKEGGPVLDTDGTVMGTEPLPAATSNISMGAVEAMLGKVKDLDLTDIPEGEVASTRLLSLEQRMSLIRFTDSLVDLPRETLIGYYIQVSLYLQGQVGKDSARSSSAMAPDWIQPALRICDSTLLGQSVLMVAGYNKDTIIDLLKQALPELVRMEGMRDSGKA
jgi:hypothetical protein